MARNFNRQKDELLIEAVKEHKVIFDANHEHFKNNIIKHKSWEKISAAIGIPVEDCKKRWKSLRDQFNKRRKAVNLGIGSGRLAGDWEYMTLMSFISQNCSDDCETGGDIKQCPEDYDNIQDTNFTLETNDSDDYKSPASAKKRKLTNDEYVHILQKKDEDDGVPPYEQVLKTKLTIDKTPLQKFFESMADAVESLPPHVQAEVKLRVCQIVTEAELNVYAHGGCSH